MIDEPVLRDDAYEAAGEVPGGKVAPLCLHPSPMMDVGGRTGTIGMEILEISWSGWCDAMPRVAGGWMGVIYGILRLRN